MAVGEKPFREPVKASDRGKVEEKNGFFEGILEHWSTCTKRWEFKKHSWDFITLYKWKMPLIFKLC